MSDATETILTTCPRDCYDSCGIAVVKRNGVIAQVRGDPRHPISRGKLCVKCSTGYNREWRDPQARLTHPLRRIGPKGAGQCTLRAIFARALPNVCQGPRMARDEGGTDSRDGGAEETTGPTNGRGGTIGEAGLRREVHRPRVEGED